MLAPVIFGLIFAALVGHAMSQYVADLFAQCLALFPGAAP